MAKQRKPIPKTQKEIANSLVTPYDQEQGNPNNAVPNPKNAINPAAFNGLAVIKAAAMATYTKPQGNNPFKKPSK